MYVCRNSCIRRGYSRSADPQQAARELFESIYHPQASLGVFFCSTEYNLHALERELSRGFGDIPLIGCTSAGEDHASRLPQRRHHRLHPGQARTSSPSRRRSPTCASFSILQGHEIVRGLRDELEQLSSGFSPDDTFALLLIDGLCKCEEIVVSSLSAALGDIPLIGGSSGGNLNFQSSYVFHGRQFHTDSAVLTSGAHPAAVQAVHHRPLRQLRHQDGRHRSRPGRPHRHRDQRRAGRPRVRPPGRPRRRQADADDLRHPSGGGEAGRALLHALDPEGERGREPAASSARSTRASCSPSPRAPAS